MEYSSETWVLTKPQVCVIQKEYVIKPDSQTLSCSGSRFLLKAEVFRKCLRTAPPPSPPQWGVRGELSTGGECEQEQAVIPAASSYNLISTFFSILSLSLSFATSLSLQYRWEYTEARSADFLLTSKVFVAAASLTHRKCTKSVEQITDGSVHRRRMGTEAKAKVVASVWGKKLFHSLPR